MKKKRIIWDPSSYEICNNKKFCKSNVKKVDFEDYEEE